MTSRPLLAVVAAALLARPLAAEESPSRRDGLPGLEGAVHRAAEERARLLDARRSRSAAAVALADEIARLKANEAAPRAGRELEARLRDLDRLAAALDDLDTRIAARTRDLQRAAAAFEVAAEAEAARVASPAEAGGAAALRAIEASRRRVAEVAVPDVPFRPLLDVGLAAGDGAPEIAAKLALLASERRRGQDEIARLEEQERLLAARMDVKRRLAVQVDAARRDAGGDFELLVQEADDLRFALRDLARQHDDVARRRAEIAEAVQALEARSHEFGRREAP
ncbi:MAG: hypothetical protein HY317_01705 [Acidobacteria bacterium]|nr:hypothetical protein [Acidobacteriota bacterium]